MTEPTLRKGLLIRLSGLLLILVLFSVIIISGQSGILAPAYRLTLTALLFLAGTALAFSLFSLVQASLLNPLIHLRSWLSSLREGRNEPIPVAFLGAWPDLADDLNRVGKRLENHGMDRAGKGDKRSLEPDSLQVLYEVVSSINTAHGLDDLLTRFLFTIKRITHAHAAAIWITHNPHQVELATSSGLDQSLIQGGRKDIRRCLYERAMTEGKIWVEQNLDKCEKIAGRPLFDRQDLGLVSVPMRYRGKIIGIINLFLGNRTIDHVESMKPLLTSIGHHLSIAIERSRSDEETHKHLINDERTRIAHELHDSLAQSLASLRYQVRVLDETLHQGDESTTWQQLERIENSLDEANTELRELIGNFRAPVSNRGLIGAIEQMVNQFRSENGIKTYLQKDWIAEDLNKETEVQILRIIQEALWNIRKHSQAKTVRIMLRHGYNDKYHILIEDDGVGISAQANGSPGEHVGLAIMRERAIRIGADLRVESEPGEGTRVVLELDDQEVKGGTT